jgi:hypothetical protein
MRTVLHNNTTIARHITAADIADGLSFFSNDNEFIQIGSWKYPRGKELAAHIHNEVERKVTRTCETLVVLSGAVEATIYTLDEEFVEQLTVSAGEILVLLECGHGYKILSDDTTVIEIKNGPYLGAEIDRRRI